MQVVVKTLATKEGISPFLANVPPTIELALDRPPVSELLRAGAKKNILEAALAAEIVRTSNKLTVGGNLREGQALEIAIQLIADFPNESLEDFCLCLRRGVKGQYGDIFRFDVLIVNNWMKMYLDEKCKVAEDVLMKEKEVYKDQYNWKGTPQTVSEETAKNYLKQWADMVAQSKVEVTEQYAAPQRRSTGYKDTQSAEYYTLKDMIRRTASEFYKGRHSFSKMSIYRVGEHEVFAESQVDAEKIYNLATKTENI